MVSVRLEKWTSSQGATGDWTESVTKYNCFAEVIRTGGGRQTANGQTVLSDDLRLRVRFRPDMKLSGNWKIVFDGIRYNITSIEKEDGKRFWWIIKASGAGVKR